MHGKQSVTKLDTKTPLFVGLPEETTVARYHSLAAQEETFPECLQVTARTSDGEITVSYTHLTLPTNSLV